MIKYRKRLFGVDTMSLIICPECNREVSDKSAVCVHCGCPLSATPSNIDMEIEIIENYLFKLQTALKSKENHGTIYNKIKELFEIAHQKICYKPCSQYDRLLFIMTKHMCYNINIITHSVVTQYFSLLNMKYVTDNGYTKCIELIYDTIKNSSRHIILWFPIYQLLENAPENNKKHLEMILGETNAFGQPKINDIYSCKDKYLSRELHLTNKLHDSQDLPKCPTCGSTNIKCITTANRAVSVLTLGILSGKIGKNYECLDCKSRW